MAYNPNNPNGQATGANSAPVVLASDKALPAGTNVIGKVTTDQTTHGTTDLVASDTTKVGGTAVDTSTGNASAGTQRVVLASNQPIVSVAAFGQAGTNIMGKVGIDQTTPGTTNGVAVNSGFISINDGTNTANVLKSDGTAAGQNALEVAGSYQIQTWSVSAPGTTSAFDAGNYRWVSVHTSAYTSGTIGFQASNDGLVWSSQTLSQSGIANASGGTAAASVSIFAGPLYGRYFRLNITGAGATNAGTIIFSTMPGAMTTYGVSASQSGTWTVGSNSATGSAVPANAFYLAGKDASGNLAGVLVSSLGDGVASSSGMVNAIGALFNGTNYDRARSAAGAPTGTAATALLPATSGGTSIYSGSITTTVTAVKASAGQLYGWQIGNANATNVYVQIFNVAAASVTLGTTAPTMSLFIPTGGGATLNLPQGIAFGTAISVACTTTRTGSTAPASSVDLNFFYA